MPEQSLRTERTLKAGMTAVWDTFAGLVPVKVEKIIGEAGIANSSQQVKFTVAAPHGPYLKGEQFERSALWVCPRTCVKRVGSGNVLMAHWVEPDPEKPFVTVNGIKIYTENVDGIEVVNICHWIDATYGKGKHPRYEEMGKDLAAWCNQYNSAYYAAPKEDFSLFAAAHQAKAEGKCYVVVEDLS